MFAAPRGWSLTSLRGLAGMKNDFRMTDDKRTCKTVMNNVTRIQKKFQLSRIDINQNLARAFDNNWSKNWIPGNHFTSYATKNTAIPGCIITKILDHTWYSELLLRIPVISRKLIKNSVKCPLWIISNPILLSHRAIPVPFHKHFWSTKEVLRLDSK